MGTPVAVVVELEKLERMSLRTTPLVDSTLRITPFEEFDPSPGYGPAVSPAGTLQLVVLELEDDEDDEEEDDDEDEDEDDELELDEDELDPPPPLVDPPPPQAAATAPTPERPMSPRTLRRPRIWLAIFKTSACSPPS